MSIVITKATLEHCAEVSKGDVDPAVISSIRTLQKQLDRNSIGTTPESVIKRALSMLADLINGLKCTLQKETRLWAQVDLAAQIEHDEKVARTLNTYLLDTLGTPGMYNGPMIPARSLRQCVTEFFHFR